MTRRKPKRSRTRADDGGQDDAGQQKTPPNARRWVFRLVAMVGGPAVFLIILELLLRLFGFGYTTAFLVPCETADGEALCTNLKATWSYFPPEAARQPISTTVASSKPQGTYRIFVLGASAAQGDPQPAFSFGRILQVMLEDSYPKTNFEVVNTAITAINSHVVRDIARHCAEREPDLFIVYLGNNEVVGPFGPGSVFSPLSGSSSLRRSVTLVKKTYVAQLIQRLARVVGATGARDWGGMSMFLDNQIPWRHAELEPVYDHFRQNLQDICDSASQNGIQIALCTVATNLSACPPFASLHRTDLTPNAQLQWEAAFSTGQAHEKQKDFELAIESFSKAAAIDDQYADLAYLLGKCHLALGRSEEARRLLTRARDLDTLRFRADSPINRIIREVVAVREGNVTHLIDFSRDLEDAASGGIPGEAFFHDHVHLNFHGNYLLALSLWRTIKDILPDGIRQGDTDAPYPLTEQQCAQRLAFSDWDQLLAIEDMVSRLRRPPFSHQLDHQQRLQEQQERLTQLRAETQPEQLARIAGLYESVLAENAQDHQTRFNYAILLTRGLSRYSEAETQLRRIVRHVPHDVHAWCVLADVLFEQGKVQDAVVQCRQALRVDPLDYTAHSRLGRFLLEQGRFDEAVAAQKASIQLKPLYTTAHDRLQEALRLRGRLADAVPFYATAVDRRPDSTTLRINYARVLAETGNINLAIVQLRESIERGGDVIDARLALGRLLATHDPTAALVQFREAIELAPERHEPHIELGDMFLKAGKLQEADKQYEEVLRLKPRFAAAHFMRGFVSEQEGEWEDAVRHYEKAISLNADLADAHDRLGDLLTGQEQLDAAATHFAEFVRIKPERPQGRQKLAIILSRLGRHDKAIAQLREIVTLRPDYFESHYNLGSLLFVQERVDEAFTAWSHAALLNPRHAEVHHKMAVALFQLGRKDEAVAECTEAIKLDPQHLKAHRNLGHFLLDLNRWDEAAAQFEAALQLDPAHEPTKQNLKRTREHRSANKRKSE